MQLLVPSRVLGTGYDDLGFKRVEDGYEVFVPDHSARDLKIGQEALADIEQQYRYFAQVERLEQLGYTVVEETEEDGEIHLEVYRGY